MNAGERKQPWWRKKRWLLLPLWLGAIYVASAGPAVYAIRYGWLPMPVAHFPYDPLDAALKNVPGARAALGWYFRWWSERP